LVRRLSVRKLPETGDARRTPGTAAIGDVLSVQTVLCADDARDAYQRGLESLLHRGASPRFAGCCAGTSRYGW
jgi:hypothetical protein